MKPYDVYRISNLLRLHFTQAKFNFLKSSENTKIFSEDKFERVPEYERISFQRISELKEPKTYMIGNCIYGNHHYRQYDNDTYLKYRETITNGPYIVRTDLVHLKSKFSDNFTVESSDIPYIISLYMREKISLYTLCAMEKLVRWADKTPSNILTESTLNQMRKSIGFFKIEENKLKQAIVDHYKYSR